MIEVVGVEELKARFESLKDYLRYQAVGDITQDAYDKSKEIVGKNHVVTGKLESNLSHRVNRSQGVGVIWVANRGMLVPWRGKRINYAVFVHFGTKPHVIKPKDKKALRWVGNDAVFHFAKAVRHPGYRGDPFLYKGVNFAKKRFQNILERWK